MGEPFVTHKVISLFDPLQVLSMDSNTDSKEQLLRSFRYLSMLFQKVTFLHSFEPKNIIIEVSFVVNYRLKGLMVLNEN